MLRHLRSVSVALAFTAFVLTASCGGDGGTGPSGGGGGGGGGTPVPTNVTVTSGAITLSTAGQTSTITATVRDQNGAIISSPSLSFSSSNTAAATVSSAGVVTAVATGSSVITVTSGTASTTVPVTVSITQTISPGVPVTNLSGGPGTNRQFSVQVPAGVPGVLEFALSGGTGDADLIVRFGSPPVPPSTFDCGSLLVGNVEACSFTNPQAGTWYVVVAGFDSYSGVSLSAAFRPVTTLQSGVAATGLSAGAGGNLYFDFDLPSTSGPAATAVQEQQLVLGFSPEKDESMADLRTRMRAGQDLLTGPQPQSGTPPSLTARTSGGTGDVDLAGTTQANISFSETVFECVSATDGNVEECTIQSPTGSVKYVLIAFEPFSGVSFQVDYDPGTPSVTPGTITVQKAVQSSSGGVADNPAGPSLAGFQFEARTAGTASVIGSATTTASGEAVISLPPGTYDLVESDSQGLTDVTSASNGITVTEGGNVNVNWVNRQAPISSGTITIQKAVQSSTGAAADNPAGPSLAGFQFQARTAGTANVVGSATTAANGQAVITLAPGNYDLVESNNQGLTDFTTAINGVTVPVSGNVNVNWVNRQAALPSGNQDPTPIINASPGSLPSGDGNATTVTLYAGNSTDPDGDPLTFTWSAPDGIFTGGTNANSTTALVTFPGNAGHVVTLTADDGEGGSAQTQTTITQGSALPAPGAFNIELVNLATPSAAVQTALNTAAATWETIIRGNLSSINFSGSPVAADTCIDGQPEINDIVDDVRIYVDISPIDGPGMVLGSAGPCFTRISDGTPIVGSMNFDSDDLNSLSASTLNAVILHEMAHILGIGTLWDGDLQNPSCSGGACDSSDPPGPDTRYLGSTAVAAWRSLGGTNTTGVPVENGDGVSAGPGTRDGHWREIVFGTELMTGFVNSSGANPLSQLTIAVLVDLGFTVDFAQADSYTVPALIAGPSQSSGIWERLELGDDIRKGTVFQVDDQGRVGRTFQIGR